MSERAGSVIWSCDQGALESDWVHGRRVLQISETRIGLSGDAGIAYFGIHWARLVFNGTNLRLFEIKISLCIFFSHLVPSGSIWLLF